MANAILSIAGSKHQSHDKLVMFPGEDSTLLWVFQHCYVHSHFQCGTVDQILIKGDRMRLIVKVFWIQRNCPDLFTKSSSLDSSVTQWGHRTKSPGDEGAEGSPVQESNFKEIVEAQTILNKSPIMVTKTDLLIVIEPTEAQINANNDNPLWLMLNGLDCRMWRFYRGRVNFSPYLLLYTQPWWMLSVILVMHIL